MEQILYYRNSTTPQNFTVIIHPVGLDPNGVCLIKRVSKIPVVGPLLDHYGVVVGANLLRAIGVQSSMSLIIQKDEAGITFNEKYIPSEWQIVGKAEVYAVPAIIERAKFALTYPTDFNIFSSNCEQFARFIFDGIEQSYQSQAWGALAVASVAAFIASRK